MKKKILFLFLIGSFTLWGQREKTPVQFWVKGGFGQSASEGFSQSGLVGGMGFGLSERQQLLSIQYNRFWEPAEMNELKGEVNEWKIQYGWIRTKSRNHFYAITGLSFIEDNHFKEVFRSDGVTVVKEMTSQTAFGWVIETGMNLVLDKHIALGMGTFVDVNKQAFTAGYRINLLLGLFKKY